MHIEISIGGERALVMQYDEYYIKYFGPMGCPDHLSAGYTDFTSLITAYMKAEKKGDVL